MKKTQKKKIVYVPMAVDILHEGHLNIINKAKLKGDVYVGLLTDKAIANYKSIPIISYEERYKIVENLKNVKKIIKQEDTNYTFILNKLKPDYFIHGDDWKNDNRKKIRANVIKILKKNGGKFIEVKSTYDISKNYNKKLESSIFSIQSRVSILKRLINSKKLVRILEAHSPLAGLIIERLKIAKKNFIHEFDGIWSSSLTDSTLRGKPDDQSVDLSARFNGISEILDVTKKPIIFDADNGGRLEHISWTIKTLERLGVSAIMIEDKIGLKKNSLFKDQKNSELDSIKNFSDKIKVAVKAKSNADFCIIARIESFILRKGLNDALLRANAYSKAGADLIMIHSNEKNPNEIFSFCKKFYSSEYYKPIVVVPTTYSKVKESELIRNHVSIVIYANHLLRASYPAMYETAYRILKCERSFDVEKKLSKVSEILSLI